MAFIVIFPIAFGAIALRLVWRASDTRIGRAVAALGIVAGYWCANHWEFFEGLTLWPWLVAVIVAGILGAPISRCSAAWPCSRSLWTAAGRSCP